MPEAPTCPANWGELSIWEWNDGLQISDVSGSSVNISWYEPSTISTPYSYIPTSLAKGCPITSLRKRNIKALTPMRILIRAHSQIIPDFKWNNLKPPTSSRILLLYATKRQENLRTFARPHPITPQRTNPTLHRHVCAAFHALRLHCCSMLFRQPSAHVCPLTVLRCALHGTHISPPFKIPFQICSRYLFQIPVQAPSEPEPVILRYRWKCVFHSAMSFMPPSTTRNLPSNPKREHVKCIIH